MGRLIGRSLWGFVCNDLGEGGRGWVFRAWDGGMAGSCLALILILQGVLGGEGKLVGLPHPPEELWAVAVVYAMCYGVYSTFSRSRHVGKAYVSFEASDVPRYITLSQQVVRIPIIQLFPNPCPPSRYRLVRLTPLMHSHTPPTRTRLSPPLPTPPSRFPPSSPPTRL